MTYFAGPELVKLTPENLSQHLSTVENVVFVAPSMKEAAYWAQALGWPEGITFKWRLADLQPARGMNSAMVVYAGRWSSTRNLFGIELRLKQMTTRRFRCGDDFEDAQEQHLAEYALNSQRLRYEAAMAEQSEQIARENAARDLDVHRNALLAQSILRASGGIMLDGLKKR